MSSNSLPAVLAVIADAADPKQQARRGDLLKAVIAAQQGQKGQKGLALALLRRDYRTAAGVLATLGQAIREGGWQNALDHLFHTSKDQDRAVLLGLIAAAAEGATVDTLEAALIQCLDDAGPGYIRINFGSSQAIAIAEAIVAADAQPPARPRGKRLCFDDASQTVTLDGRPFPVKNPTAYLFLKGLDAAGAAGATTRQLHAIPGLLHKRFDRAWPLLPPELQAIVVSQRGHGYWLRLPPESRP
jgi:hypothetical protein